MDNNLNKDKKIRILSLDGGGIRGLITAHILQEVEKQLQCAKGESLRDYFDIIAGTSTGSILAAGIATGIPITKMIEIYQEKGKKIFSSNIGDKFKRFGKRVKVFFKSGLRRLSVPFYDNQGLIEILKSEDIFGEKTLKEVGRYPEKQDYDSEPKPILLIPAYDTLYRNTTFFTNYYDKNEFPNGHPWYYEQPLWKICTSSASAPTFFPGFKLDHEEILPLNDKDGKPIKATSSYPHVDGGVTANNPSLCAIARALELGYQLENISLLSIGTGTDTEPYEFKQIEDWGLLSWARRIANLFMGGQAEVQARICRSLMGGSGSERYLRLQFELNQTVYDREDLTKGKNEKLYQKLYKKIYKKIFKNQKVDYSDDQIREALKTYAQMPVIPEKKWWKPWAHHKRVNKITGTHVDNKMDNAKKENIKVLDEFAGEYINYHESYTFKNRNEHGSQIKKAIEDFVNEQPQKIFPY